MWLMKNVVMDEFAAEVKKGKYKKIDYPTWRELKKLPDEWDLDIIYSLNNCSEVDSRYVSISWDGCIYPYELSANDGSLGEYIKTLLDFYNAPSLSLNTSAFSNAINKASEAAAKAAEEATIRTKVEGIKNLMDSLKLTAQQAMAALKIPESDYPKYIAML